MIRAKFVFDLQRFATISNGNSNISINGSAGNDSVENYSGSSVTINTGEGDNSISNSSLARRLRDYRR